MLHIWGFRKSDELIYSWWFIRPRHRLSIFSWTKLSRNMQHEHVNIIMIIANCRLFNLLHLQQRELLACRKLWLTLFARSTSPHGSLRSNSMPVSGVPVGGRSIEASIVKYSTFSGRFCGTTICTSKGKMCQITSWQWKRHHGIWKNRIHYTTMYKVVLLNAQLTQLMLLYKTVSKPAQIHAMGQHHVKSVSNKKNCSLYFKNTLPWSFLKTSAILH